MDFEQSKTFLLFLRKYFANLKKICFDLPSGVNPLLQVVWASMTIGIGVFLAVAAPLGLETATLIFWFVPAFDQPSCFVGCV